MLHTLFYVQTAYAGGATNTEPGLAFGIGVIALGAAGVILALVRMSRGPGPTN